MRITRAMEITEQLNHARDADSSGKHKLAQRYRDRAQHLIDIETLELEQRLLWQGLGLDIDIDLSAIVEPFDEYDVENLFEKITTST